VITLDKTNDNKELKVLPLQLSDGSCRSKPNASQAQGRLFEARADEYEVAWRNIDKVDFFEELVLREAAKVVAEAVALTGAESKPRRRRNTTRRLSSTNGCCGSILKPGTSGSHSRLPVPERRRPVPRQTRRRGLRVLEELYARTASTATKADRKRRWAAMERVGERLIGLQAEAQNYRAARLLLERCNACTAPRSKSPRPGATS